MGKGGRLAAGTLRVPTSVSMVAISMTESLTDCPSHCAKPSNGKSCPQLIMRCILQVFRGEGGSHFCLLLSRCPMRLVSRCLLEVAEHSAAVRMGIPALSRTGRISSCSLGLEVD